MRAKPSSSCTYFTHFNSINQKTAAPEPEARACHADNMYMLPHPQPTCYSQKVSAHHTYHTYVQHSPPGPVPQRPWTVACLIVRQVRKTFCLAAWRGCHDSCRQAEARDNGTTPKASKFMRDLRFLRV